MAIAQLLFVLTGGGSALLLVALIGLVIRRGWQESRSRLDAARGSAFRAALLPLMGQSDPPLAALDRWRGDPVALEVSEHLLQLMRGAERDKLLNIAERLDLLQPELASLRSARPLRRIAAARKLGSFPSERVCDALHACFASDPDAAVRLEAGLALVRLQSLPPVGETLAALDDGAFATPAHRIVLRALAAQRPDEMIAAFAQFREGAARFAVVDALGDIFDPRAFAALREAVADPDPQLRCEALRAMRRIGHPSVAGAIVAALGDPEWIVRVQAAATAGAMRLEAARARLRALTADPHWWVRYRAGEALANMTRAAAAA